jgi:GNAT superfamily N-acetyltransferase
VPTVRLSWASGRARTGSRAFRGLEPQAARSTATAAEHARHCIRRECIVSGVSAAADYVLDDDRQRIDLDAIWSFLSTGAYWARWRSRADVARQLQTAWRVVGAYHGDATVGFARAVSDGVAFAYLADVFVLPGHRGRGLGRRLIATMIDEGPGREFRWLLHTSDAHALYAEFGFAPPDATLLERPGARPAL